MVPSPAPPPPQTTYDARYAIPAAVAASSEAKVAEWQDMKYAMFIHWGVYSSYAGWYKGQKQEVGYPRADQGMGPPADLGLPYPPAGHPPRRVPGHRPDLRGPELRRNRVVPAGQGTPA